MLFIVGLSFIECMQSCMCQLVPRPGADPGAAGKGRGTNRVSCRWLGRALFSSSVLHF